MGDFVGDFNREKYLERTADLAPIYEEVRAKLQDGAFRSVIAKLLNDRSVPDDIKKLVRAEVRARIAEPETGEEFVDFVHDIMQKSGAEGKPLLEGKRPIIRYFLDSLDGVQMAGRRRRTRKQKRSRRLVKKH